MEYRKIVQKEKDMTGKWRVWIEVADKELMMLKFQQDPKELEVKEEIDKIIANQANLKQQELGQIKQQIERLTIIEAELEREIKVNGTPDT